MRADPLPAPLLIPAEQAATLCGRSRAAGWRDHAAARIPAPVKIGGRTLWRAEELRHWIDAGCPERKAWDASRKHGRG